MCDYCDCRRVPEIAELGAEHEQITELAHRVLRLAQDSSPELASAMADLRRILDAHVAREETGIFVQARENGIDGRYIDELEDDHASFASAFSEPEELDADALERLFKDLDRHIAFEEYDLFPAASQVLPDSAWEKLSRSG